MEPGSWTAHDDLAELAGTHRERGRGLPGQRQVKLANAYRVLNADGSIPAEGMLHFAYRGIDLRQRLADEGIEFDADGRAARSSA